MIMRRRRSSQALTWWPDRRRMPQTPGFLRAEVAETSASRTHLREIRGTVLPAFTDCDQNK